VNRTELVNEIARRTGLLADDVSTVLDGLQGVVADTVAAGQKVLIPGMLTVEGVRRSERADTGPSVAPSRTRATRDELAGLLPPSPAAAPAGGHPVAA
jgi:DNA-binding protein HU-beta